MHTLKHCSFSFSPTSSSSFQSQPFLRISEVLPMDDQALDMLCYNLDHAVSVSEDNFKHSSVREIDQTLETPKLQTEKLEGNSDIVDESKESVGEYIESKDDTEETCSYQQQTLPIFQKIENLSSKLQHLRKEHAVLCNEVKDITANSFPGSEVCDVLQNLSVEHESLKKKFLEECELLKKKYLEEYNERKRLYNEVIELKGNIRVFCRCRPLNADEISNGFQSVVDFDSCQENELQIISSDSSKKHFKFDHVFRPEDNQEVVFVQTMPIVTSVLDGFNVCIFAYGQTGTGKTFTMEGTPENRGVNYRTLEELFKLSNERSSFMNYELLVSMLEVYNEKIRDLLLENSNQPAKKLEIKQSAEGTQEVPGLVDARVYSTDEVWELLKSGSRARSVGSTNANELSSRSHCLVRVTVMGENLLNGQRTRSHLWLVDLAGSERVGKIEVEGERLKESQFINKSLSALGDVISALASKTVHIPYRNSKLTHMLQSSLGGDCKTLMFVQISPNAVDLSETVCSLNFASRVRGVEQGPARRQADPLELFKYKQLAEKVKSDEKESKKLQENLQSLQLRLSAREHICRNLQEKVRDLENQLVEERKIRLKQETKALSFVTTQSASVSSFGQSQRTTTEKKPPLAPSSKLRLPLRRIPNFMPASSPALPYKTRNSMIPLPKNSDKENMPRTLMETCKTKALLKPKRLSIAVRPTTTAKQVTQPKRRASITTLRPEPNLSMTTPLNRSNAQFRSDRAVGRQSFIWDPQRVWRTTRVHSPMSQLNKGSYCTTVEETPINPRSSKFLGSPPSQAGSWRPKHPTVVALQKKQLVWSPLKMKVMRNSRKSLLC